MVMQRKVSQLRPVGVREGFLEEVAFDLGLEERVDVKEGNEIKEKHISGRKYSTCKSMDQLCNTHTITMKQYH